MLDHAFVDGVFEDRVPGMTNGYDSGSGLGGRFPEVASKGEDRPVVVDSAEDSILTVVENTIRDERGANGNVTASPLSRVKVLHAPCEKDGVVRCWCIP